MLSTRRLLTLARQHARAPPGETAAPRSGALAARCRCPINAKAARGDRLEPLGDR